MKVSLTDICDFQGGTQPPKDEWIDQPAQGYVRMLQIRDFTQSDKNYIEYVKDTGKLKTCIEDDILIGRYGASIGKILTGLAGAYNVAIVKTIPDEKVVSKKYLYWYLNSQYFQRFISNVGSRAAQAGFNKNDLGVAQIPLVDKERQEEICEVLEKANKLISLRKQQLAKLDEVVKARFVEMFGDFKSNSKGWSIVKFDEFAQIDGNMTTDYKKYADYPHIGIDSIEKGTGALKGYRTVKEDGVVSGKYIFTPQHIIYSKIRPNLNKVALPDFEGLCSADAYPILPNPKNCNRIFLALAMRSDYFLDYILQFSARTNLPKVNRKEIAGFSMPLPPLSLQNDFATFVERVDQQKQTVQQSLEKLELMKKALMQEYFG